MLFVILRVTVEKGQQQKKKKLQLSYHRLSPKRAKSTIPTGGIIQNLTNTNYSNIQCFSDLKLLWRN